MAEIDLKQIELLVLDVDGVMTDGRITLTPDGEEIKTFHVRDGLGMRCWKLAGKKLAIFSGRSSKVVTQRARELKVDVVHLNVKHKLSVYQETLRDLDLTDSQAAVIGDDLTDLPLFHSCGFAVAVADACEELRTAAAYVTQLPGGSGCVRETIERILKGAGEWAEALDKYMQEG
ncbi:MAG: KdsC family phosphatase [Planctomycetota bacterium]|jgi:3-deoxy-D-manno-octulosonate 8-phosphate phosphatase (KDO 8-P phosphatase)